MQGYKFNLYGCLVFIIRIGAGGKGSHAEVSLLVISQRLFSKFIFSGTGIYCPLLFVK